MPTNMQRYKTTKHPFASLSQRRGRQQKQQQYQCPFPADIDCPFKVVLPAFDSSFELKIPHRYREAVLPDGQNVKRSFFFTNLEIIPGFFSMQAAALNMDVEEESDKAIPFTYRLFLNYKMPRAFVDILKFDQGNVFLDFPNYYWII